MNKLVLFLVCFFVSELGNSMDVTRDEKKNEHTLYLSGIIAKGDLKKVISAIAPPAVFPKYFTLESPGGDTVEAMAIGRFIRETASGTLVAKHCAGACVLIFIAGVSRTASDGDGIGLRRPYYDPKELASLSLPDAEKKHRALREVTRRYAEEMEMPTATIEKMFSVSSEDVYYLTPFEKEQVRVIPSAYSEWIRAKCSPPTAQERQLFIARGFNFFDQFDKRPPTDPAFWEFVSKLDRAEKCENAVVRDVRKTVVPKYANW